MLISEGKAIDGRPIHVDYMPHPTLVPCLFAEFEEVARNAARSEAEEKELRASYLDDVVHEKGLALALIVGLDCNQRHVVV